MTPDHAAVYAAEVAAFHGTSFDDRIPLDVAVALARRVIGSSWWPGPHVVVSGARADAGSSSTRCRASLSPLEIRIARPQATPATIAHELAHALAGLDAEHGPSFRAAYLDTTAVVSNIDTTRRRGRVHRDQLQHAFDAAGLRVASRSWPAPPAPLDGRPIPLARIDHR